MPKNNKSTKVAANQPVTETKTLDLTKPVTETKKPEPTQLDRIEALLIELVESNRKLHPNISEVLNSGFKR